jgi:hypothetical protein
MFVVCTMVKKMLAQEPDARPTAQNLQSEIDISVGFLPQDCCGLDPEPYVAYEAQPSH